MSTKIEIYAIMILSLQLIHLATITKVFNFILNYFQYYTRISVNANMKNLHLVIFCCLRENTYTVLSLVLYIRINVINIGLHLTAGKFTSLNYNQVHTN